MFDSVMCLLGASSPDRIRDGSRWPRYALSKEENRLALRLANLTS